MKQQVTICDICEKPIDKKTSLMELRANPAVYNGDSFVAEVHNKCFKEMKVTWRKVVRRGRKPQK